MLAALRQEIAMLNRIGTSALMFLLAAPAVWAQTPKPKADPATATALRDGAGTLAIDGSTFSFIGCSGGQYNSIHALGGVTSGVRIRVTIESGEGIDPMATLLILQMGNGVPSNVRANYSFDDDSGGGRDPRVELTAPYNGNVILSIGSYDGAFGCYAVKVEMS